MPPDVTAHRVRLWIRRELADRAVFYGRPLLCVLAFVWRRLLVGTTFVTVTGSLGKTTTKECVAACLATRYSTIAAGTGTNSTGWLAWSVLRVRPWHRYAVLEVAAGRPGRIAPRITLVRPDVAVVLGVARTHTRAYSSLDLYAAEKRRLVDSLRPGGLAVLNADDPRVSAMAPPPGCAVLRCGTGEAADVRGEVVAARWPERLTLRVSTRDECRVVRTQLVGDHWTPAVLAALAVAGHAGIPLATAAPALERLMPLPGRIQPMRLPGEITILRDDFNAAVDTLAAAIRVLASARASRRILVVTDYSDSGMNRKNRLRHLAQVAAEAADVAVFVGESADYGSRRAVEAGMAPERVHHFATLQETTSFLRSELGRGDLLLLKGRSSDHATRVFHALLGPIRCWRTGCGRRIPCDTCWELGARPADGRRAVPVVAGDGAEGLA